MMRLQTIVLSVLLFLSTSWAIRAQSSGWYILTSSNIKKVQNELDLVHEQKKDLSSIKNGSLAVAGDKKGDSSEFRQIYSKLTRFDLNHFIGKACLLVVEVDQLSSSAQRLLREEEGSYRNIFQISYLKRELLDHLLSADLAFYLEEVLVTRSNKGRVLDLNLNPNHIAWVHAQMPALHGDGLVISFKEANFLSSDLDLRGRVLDLGLASGITTSHATEVAIVAAGGGITNRTAKGAAHRAKMFSSNFDRLLPDDFNLFPSQTVVQNHSYGTERSNRYDALAYAYDLASQDFPFLTHIFSSGNEGAIPDAVAIDSTFDNFATLTGALKAAKNVLVVGAVDTLDRLNPFSSHGPTIDGRIKPELTAYSMSGTSNAAALVSGSSVLMQQLYDSLYQSKLSSAAVKALLVNTSRDIGTAGPEHRSGWGVLDLKNAVQSIEAHPLIMDTLSSGDTLLFDIGQIADARHLSVTLAWTDPAAIPGAIETLNNDLDITLIGPEGSFLPWVLSSYPSLDSLEAPARRGQDHQNNLERITVDDPVPGFYQIMITSTSMRFPSQAFVAAIASRPKDCLEWTYPVAGANMPYDGETAGYFRWQTSLDLIANLHIRPATDSASWTVIGENLELSHQAFRWMPPDSLSGLYVARLVDQQGRAYLTDTFTISKPPQIRVNLLCGDSASISWDPIPGVVSYRLSLMTTNHHEMTILDGVNSMIPFESGETPFIQVTPMVKETALMSSMAFDVSDVGAVCYFQSYFTETAPDKGVRSYLQLSSVEHVKKLRCFRVAGDVLTLIDEIIPSEALHYEFFDDSPSSGYNSYMIELELAAGSLYSDISSAFYFGNEKLVIFPNPAQSDRQITIYNEGLNDDGLYLSIFDVMGRMVYHETLKSDRQLVDASRWESGIYIYHVQSSHKKYSGRIIINK